MTFLRLALIFALLTVGSLWYVPEDPSPTDFFAILAVGCTLASLRFVQKPLRVFYALLYAFLIANIISMLVANVPSHALSNLMTIVFLLSTLIVYPTLAANMGEKPISHIYTAIIFAVTLSSVIGILAYMGLMPGPTIWYYRSELYVRLSPFFQDPNVYSPFLCFGAAFVLTLFWDRKKVPIAFLLTGLVLLCIILSFSRAGLLNFFVMGFIFLLLTIFIQKDRRVKRRFVFFAFSGFAVAAIALPIAVEFFGIGEMLTKRMQIQEYDTERFAAQDLAIQISMDRPLGVGPGHYTGVQHFPQSEFYIDAHNLYLKVLVERGWLGFASFMGIIFYCFLIGFKTIKRNAARARYSIALLASLTGLLVNSFFISSMHWRHFFVILGLILAEYVLMKNKERSETLALAKPAQIR